LYNFVAEHAANRLPDRKRVVPFFTRREEQLILLIGRGLTNREMAAKLNLSEETVKNHVHRILRKVGVGNCCSLTAGLLVEHRRSPG
jgi:DNA-binding NarL/FixJ family response regulator